MLIDRSIDRSESLCIRHVQAENFHREALAQRRAAGASGPDDLAPFCYNLALVVGTNARKGPPERMAQGHLEVGREEGEEWTTNMVSRDVP